MGLCESLDLEIVAKGVVYFENKGLKTKG